ncbi:MAG TPA: hypothetical protein VGS22_28350 [Thermoanaerobaculia bacterium]|jgi:hypothetical protein|nr:hypothetical protein [Thermoanaerobaculia bacterium]
MAKFTAQAPSRVRLVALAACLIGALFPSDTPRAEEVTVRRTEGALHGFLVLSTLAGKRLADGDLTQVAHGDQITSTLAFHFRDGSLHEETAVFSQSHRFHLVSDHLVQKGPAFPRPMDVTIDRASGRVTVRTTDDDGKKKVIEERLDLPADLANGVLLTLLKNIPRDGQHLTLPMLATSPKPRLVTLQIAPAGQESFSVGGSKRKATHYVVKVELGGIAGVLAPLVGKQPPDNHVWILGGEVPAFVKSEAPLYAQGPLWRMELASPVWR